MTPRVCRVRDRGTFEELRRRGRRVRRGPVTVTWLPGALDMPPRVAYAIGKPFGPAVARNRMRRRLRAVVHDVAAAMPAGTYLIGVSPAAAALTHEELTSAVTEAFAAVPGAPS